MLFTNEEFHIMVHELLYSEPVSFHMLCQIAEKTLRSSVTYWCNAEECLRGRDHEEDIMQEIHLRLMNTAVTHFLLRDDVEGDYNDDPEGFEDWMFTVAKNLKRSYANRVRGTDIKTEELEKAELCGVQDVYGEEQQERIDRLRQAFAIVLDADVGVYKVLTWVAQLVFIVNNDITKIKSNELIVQTFENKTLYQMYELVLRAAQEIPWLAVTAEQHEKIMDSLRKPWDGSVIYGEVPYKTFFMKHNGAVSGKKSISDWVNRMNGLVRRRMGEESSDRELTTRRGSYAAPDS